MNRLVQYDLNTLEIMIIRMIWIINMKNMTMIDMQSQKNAAHLFDDIDTNSSSDSPVKKS